MIFLNGVHGAQWSILYEKKNNTICKNHWFDGKPVILRDKNTTKILYNTRMNIIKYDLGN